MRIVNKTNIKTSLLMRIIEYSKPHRLKDFDIEIKYWKHKHIDGGACQCMMHPFVLIRLPINKIKFPVLLEAPKEYRKKGYISFHCPSYNAAIVYIIAHELHHLRFKYKGKKSERTADKYAIRKALKWRRT